MLAPDSIVVRPRGAERGLFAGRSFRAGETVAPVPCLGVRTTPTRYTIQVGRDRHIEAGPLTYLNHSCQPNLRIDTERMQLTACQDIAAGDELTFFYPATEWDMAEPFNCHCGQLGCLGRVAGARFVPLAVLARQQPSAHVVHMLTVSGRESPRDLGTTLDAG